MFAGFLKFADHCPSCGLDFSGEDAGDGPAVFIMFAVGFIVVPMALVAEVVFSPPLWLHFMLWLPLTAGLSLALMRPFRAIMFALQHQHAAAEGQIDGGEGDTGGNGGKGSAP